MTATNRPVILITMGDPSGVGPEVIAKSLAHEPTQRSLRPLVIGDAVRLEQAIALARVPLRVRAVSRPEDARYEQNVIDCLHLAIVPADLPFGHLSKSRARQPTNSSRRRWNSRQPDTLRRSAPRPSTRKRCTRPAGAIPATPSCWRI